MDIYFWLGGRIGKIQRRPTGAPNRRCSTRSTHYRRAKQHQAAYPIETERFITPSYSFLAETQTEWINHSAHGWPKDSA